MRLDKLAILATPALSFATLAVGLGIGSSGETTAAVIEGAPPGADRLGLAWQLNVVREDRGVREVVPNLPIRVHVNYKDLDRTITSVTTKEGASELALSLTGIAPGDSVDIDVTTNDDKHAILAEGTAKVPAETKRGDTSRGVLPALRRDGTIKVDVAIEGGSLAAELLTDVWVHATDAAGKPIPNATVHFEPVDGLAFFPPDVETCDAGWAETQVEASAMNTQGTVIVKAGKATGSWTGVLPIQMGATIAFATVDETKRDQNELSVMKATTQETTVYVELDDEHGRAWSATPTLKARKNGDFVSALLEVPAFGPQPFWAVAGSDPRSTATLVGGATALPVHFGLPNLDCKARAEHAITQPTGFARSVVLDGFAAARVQSAARRKKGMTIAICALVVGAVVEAFAVLRGARGGSAVKAPWITGKIGTVVIGVGLAMLGFAMLGAFVLTH